MTTSVSDLAERCDGSDRCLEDGWLWHDPSVEGRLLTPSEVPDRNWRIVGDSGLQLGRAIGSSLAAPEQWNDRRVVHEWIDQSEGVLLSPGQVADTDWKIRAIVLANGDYHPDLIWQHQTTGLISVWLMKGSERMDGVLLTPDRVADTNWRIVGTGYRNYWDCFY